MGNVTVTFNEVDLGAMYSCNLFRTDTDASPVREMTKISIPSRSGDLLIDGHKYPNVENEYTAVFYGENADSNAIELKNYLLSQIGYKRLTDSEHPDEYYMARISKKISPVITEERGMIKMELVFDRKPQRYLFSGDTNYSLLSGTVTGNPIFADTDDIDASSISIAFHIMCENGSANSKSRGYNPIRGVRLVVDNTTNTVWQKTSSAYGGLQAVDGTFTGSGCTITGIVEDVPRTNWVKNPNYGAVFYTPFTPIGTIAACSFLPFSTSSPQQSAVIGRTFYDSTNHMLWAAPNAQITTTEQFMQWLNQFQYLQVYETCNITRTWSGSITLPSDGHYIQAMLDARWYLPSNTADMTLDITASNTLANPSPFASKPLIRLYGNGAIAINSQTITVTNSTSYVDIDCEMMDCYEGTTNRNDDVTFSTYDFPVLEPGNNTFIVASGSGITGIRVTPRWWQV